MDEEPMIINTTLRKKIHSMTTDELYKYVWDLYKKMKNEGKF